MNWGKGTCLKGISCLYKHQGFDTTEDTDALTVGRKATGMVIAQSLVAGRIRTGTKTWKLTEHARPRPLEKNQGARELIRTRPEKEKEVTLKEKEMTRNQKERERTLVKMLRILPGRQRSRWNHGTLSTSRHWS